MVSLLQRLVYDAERGRVASCFDRTMSIGQPFRKLCSRSGLSQLLSSGARSAATCARSTMNDWAARRYANHRAMS